MKMKFDRSLMIIVTMTRLPVGAGNRREAPVEET
jgi:hypothetical protein